MTDEILDKTITLIECDEMSVGDFQRRLSEVMADNFSHDKHTRVTVSQQWDYDNPSGLMLNFWREKTEEDISEEHRKKVFEAFNRGWAAVKRKRKLQQLLAEILGSQSMYLQADARAIRDGTAPAPSAPRDPKPTG